MGMKWLARRTTVVGIPIGQRHNLSWEPLGDKVTLFVSQDSDHESHHFHNSFVFLSVVRSVEL